MTSAEDLSPQNSTGHEPGSSQSCSEEPPALRSHSSDNVSITQQQCKKITAEQWKSLKQIIRQIYLEENATIEQTAERLAHYEPFIRPTRRQLLRRLKDWGFEKNAKRNQRQAIIQSIDQGRPLPRVTQRLSKEKEKRWRRRDGHLMRSHSDEAASRTEVAEDASLPEETTNINAEVDGVFAKAPVMTPQSPPQTAFPGSEIWKVVDVTGSPKLTRLTGALTLLEIENIPTLDLTNSTDEESLESLWNPSSSGGMNSLVSNNRMVTHQNDNLLGNSFQGIGLWSVDESSPAFRISPFAELNPFPNEQPARTPFARVNIPYLSEAECAAQLRKQSSSKTPNIQCLESGWEIATRYWKNTQYAKSESWFRRIISAKQRIAWYQPLKTLQACLSVIELMTNQGKCKEAHDLQRELHAKITKQNWIDIKTQVMSMYVFAALLDRIGDRSGREELSRQALQLCLLNYGPKNPETTKAMDMLGRGLRSQKKIVESSMLLHSTVYLRQEAILESGVDSTLESHEDLVRSMISLAKTRISQGEIREAQSLLEAAQAKFLSNSLSDATIEFDLYYHLAQDMFSRELSLEAINTIHSLLERSVNFNDPPRRSTGMYLLAEILTAQLRHAEAAVWFEAAYHINEKTGGINHPHTIAGVRKLACCYLEQGLTEQALVLLEQVNDKLLLAGEKDQESAQEYVFEIQKLMRDIRSTDPAD